MAVLSKTLPIMAAMYPIIGSAIAGSLQDIDHVILFMQENRAFDHYFGAMAGVRGFSDPNIQVNSGGIPVWQQDVNSTHYLNPWYLNYLGGDWLNATQCMAAGSNGWEENQLALNHGINNHWAVNNTPWSWGHFKRDDIPVQWALAEGWTIGDMYQESVIASTNPNRVTWISGTINVPGSLPNKTDGGYPYIDNNETPGCEADGLNCYPLKWKTAGEAYSESGATWQIYQDEDNFDDNPYAWFDQFQTADPESDLYKRGFGGLSLDTFYAQAANGTLPEISYIIGPSELSEHPQYSPRDGAWLQKQIVDAVTKGAKYANSVLIISYDETGGFGDHVTPYHSPAGTQGEWLEDPWVNQGQVYSGPGFRLPFYIISPWTRGGAVLTEHADHNSQLLFLEKWLAAKGKSVTTPVMNPWRREHMSDLTAAFDFENPDYSIPDLPYAIPPHRDADGSPDGSAYCEALYSVQRPPVPYSGVPGATTNVAALSEEGFKGIRGKLTEGRYLVLETSSSGLANSGAANATGTAVTPEHDSKAQRWVAHVVELGGDKFKFSSAVDGKWLTGYGGLTSNEDLAGTFTVGFVAGKGYALQNKCGKFIALDENGKIAWSKEAVYWKTYSVTYHS